MKKTILLSIVFAAVLGMATAQTNQFTDDPIKMTAPQAGIRLVATTYIEQTSVSPKGGTAIGVVFKNAMSVGVFYQESKVVKGLMGQEQYLALPSDYEKEFYGAYFTAPIDDQGLIGFDVQIRAGISNGENFVITPSLLSSLKLTRSIELGAGVGVRAFRPTVQSSLTIKF